MPLIPPNTAAVLAGALLMIGACSVSQADTPYQRGQDLPASAIGDPAVGKQLFVDKNCADCHSYEGMGGEDAPALDFMTGSLSATDIANMSGTIWNHLPTMLPFFQAEGVPVPTFSGSEMPDLVAYLHGGSGATDASDSSYQPGDDLPPESIGDVTKGADLFTAKNCADCHSFSGAGGEDAPALDFMKGKLTAAEIAGMSGTIWNHMPQMTTYFQAEGIPVPKFMGDEMADLVAYLHDEG